MRYGSLVVCVRVRSAEHERSHPDVEPPVSDLTDDGIWERPHEPLEGRERCLADALDPKLRDAGYLE